jgi:hypothetical protein
MEAIMKNRKYNYSIHACEVVTVMFVMVLSVVLSSCGGPAGKRIVLKAEKEIESADPFMGGWQGNWKLDDGFTSGQLAAQVIALGDGKYRANLFEGFDLTTPPIAKLDGQREDGAVRFAGPGDYDGMELQIKCVIENSRFIGSFTTEDAAGSFSMEKVVHLSPTLNAKPPAGAIVLFDGKDFSQWKQVGKKSGEDAVQWTLVDGAMEVKPGSGSIVTQKKFTDFKLHLEFRTPFMPEARGQGRGNSGVYLQGRYEVQVLDSYGLEGRDNECGGIYSVGAPLVNMCAPPMQWQTYDITFHAPRFDGAGNRTRDAIVTVDHNGVKIHDRRKVPNPTGGALDSNVNEPGGIYLQDHGNRVQYRNIWLVELNGG